MHREYVIAALERGKHVFCETPIALSVEDADAMIAAARAHKRILMVALVMRFVANYTYIHDAVVSGELGRPLAAYAYRLSPPYWPSEKPHDQTHYAEPVVELMTFDFDYLNWLFGTPTSVFGTGVAGSSGFVEHAFVSLEFDGVRGLVEGSAMMPKSFPFSTSVRILGAEGMLETSFRLEGGEIPKSVLTHYPKTGAPESPNVPGHDPYEEECAYFVRCVQGEADPALLSAEAARDALRVSLAARESLKRGGERVMLV
jgi:predicted dehydrogenase